VKYPSDWHISNSEAESELVKADPESGIDYPFGGQVFWSNYANINDYGPADKLDDFRFLGLTIYRGNNEIINDFAKKIGAFKNATKVDFKTANLFYVFKSAELIQSIIELVVFF